MFNIKQFIVDLRKTNKYTQIICLLLASGK